MNNFILFRNYFGINLQYFLFFIRFILIDYIINFNDFISIFLSFHLIATYKECIFFSILKLISI